MSENEYIGRKNRKGTRSNKLSSFLSRKNIYSFWSTETFVNTCFALRQFQKVFKINEKSVTNISDLLIERVNDSSKVDKHVAAADNDTQEENREMTTTTLEDLSSIGDVPNLKDENAEYSSEVDDAHQHSSHDFPFNLQELFLKLMIPCSRKHFLSRIHSIIGRSLPAGVENPLGEDPRNVQAVDLPVEVRLFILSVLVDHRMQNEISQSVDEFHDASALRPQDLGRDSLGNNYWFFHDMKIWVALKGIPKYIPDEPVSSDNTSWEWTYDIVTASCNWLCVADYEQDSASWSVLIKALKADSAKLNTAKNLDELYSKLGPKFEKEMAWRESERIRSEEEERKKEFARLRELEKQFRTENRGGYGLRVSARLRGKEEDVKAKKRKEREEEELWDELVDGKRPRKRAKYEEDSDYEMSDEERRSRPPRGATADPSHGMSREERFAVRQARFAENSLYDGRNLANDISESMYPIRVRDKSEESGSSGSMRRAPIGVGDQGELVFRPSVSETPNEGEIKYENGHSNLESDGTNEVEDGVSMNGEYLENVSSISGVQDHHESVNGINVTGC